MLDKPLPILFPELNSYQIAWIRELMKREYERGLADRPFTISEPTTTQYTANVSEVKDDN